MIILKKCISSKTAGKTFGCDMKQFNIYIKSLIEFMKTLKKTKKTNRANLVMRELAFDMRQSMDTIEIGNNFTYFLHNPRMIAVRV